MALSKPLAIRIIGVLCALFLSTALLADEQPPGAIRIGVLAYRGTDQALLEWQGHADYLAARLPGKIFRILPLDPVALDRAVRNRDIELLITNTAHYTELEAAGQVSHIATRQIAGPRGPLNTFGGTAIALSGRDDIRHYRDLKGKRLLIPEKSSFGGWLVHVREALDQGVDLARDTGQLVETHNHEKVVAGVLAGEADAGLVRSSLIESMIAEGSLAPGAIKVIDPRTTADYPFLHSTRLYPEWPLARVGDFPEETTKAIQLALLDMKPDDAAAKAAQIYGWTVEQNYQPMLDLFRETKSGPYARHEISWDDIMARHGTPLLGTAAVMLLLLLAALWTVIRGKRALQRGRDSLRLAGSVFAHAEEGIVITDASGHIVQANDSVSRITGYTQAELIGQTPNVFRSPRQAPDFYRTLWQTLLSAGAWHGEIWSQRKDGTSYAQRTSISSIRDRDGTITHFIGLFSDVTELKNSQEQLEKMAYLDALTGLPNRLLLADRLKHAVTQAKRHDELLAVCYLDLDNFKPINDQWGHAAGDCLLVEVARRLTQCLRQNDTVSRLGGDEFVMLINELPSLVECERTLNRLTDALNAPFAIGDEQVQITASIGVALFPTDGNDPDTLLRHADQAMYAAKQAGRHRFELFQQPDSASAARHSNDLKALSQALENREFVLHFQPKADMRAGQIFGAEALLRWQHPEQGLLAPERFLHLFERAGMHLELGEYVLETALRQMEDWLAADLRLTISVNIDAHHLQRPEFPARLQKIFASHPTVSPQQLEIEVVETAALQDLAQVSKQIAECRKLGVQFAIDDFGTGYSSLSYLKQLPMQTLKIDRSFVHDMLEDPDDLAIVDGIVGLANAFRRKVIAEGVETVAHGTMLIHLGCDHGQGYGIARPMSGDLLPDWVRNWQAPTAWLEAVHWPASDSALLTVEIDHIRWIRQFASVIEAAPGQAPEIPELDPAACRFGQWISLDGLRRYRHLPHFADIVPLHDAVHKLAKELLALHANNPEAGRARLDEMFALRDRLVLELRRVREAVVGSGFRNGPHAPA